MHWKRNLVVILVVSGIYVIADMLFSQLVTYLVKTLGFSAILSVLFSQIVLGLLVGTMLGAFVIVANRLWLLLSVIIPAINIYVGWVELMGQPENMYKPSIGMYSIFTSFQVVFCLMGIFIIYNFKNKNYKNA